MMVSFAAYSRILQVKWLTFEASKRGETSLLEWTTVEEFNNKGFDVMRSTDGKNFEKIGWIDAAKVPQTVNRYQFIDEHPRRGVNYYQLKQWDHDGRFDFSPVRTVTFSDRNFAVSVTPNPANEFFFVDIQSEYEHSMIKLIDLTGRVVLTEEVEDRNIIARLPVDGLPAGAYTLMVESGADRFIEQVIIIE